MIVVAGRGLIGPVPVQNDLESFLGDRFHDLPMGEKVTVQMVRRTFGSSWAGWRPIRGPGKYEMGPGAGLFHGGQDKLPFVKRLSS